MMSRIFIVLFCFSLFSSCVSSTDISAEKKAISKAAVEFSKAYVEGDLNAQMKYYTEDAVILPGSANMIEGIEGVTQYWNTPESVNILTHKTTSTKLEISGTMASDYGYYEGTSVRNNDTTSFRGQYVIVWKKGEDAKWRMAVDMWSSIRNNN